MRTPTIASTIPTMHGAPQGLELPPTSAPAVGVNGNDMNHTNSVELTHTGCFVICGTDTGCFAGSSLLSFFPAYLLETDKFDPTILFNAQSQTEVTN